MSVTCELRAVSLPRIRKGRYTLSVKLSDFTGWRHTWRKNWVVFWQAIAQASELSFPVVFHTENCAVHSQNPTVSSVYLSTPRWHHLKALKLPKWIKERRPLRSLKRTDRYLNYGTQKIDIMARVKKAAVYDTIVTRTRRHTELTKKNWQTWWETCAVSENIQFSFSCSFSTQLNCTV
jgi:hypothetical protein